MLLLVTILLSNSYAQNVSLDKAQRLGEFFIKESTSLGKVKSSINSRHSYTMSSADGVPCIYVFNVDDGGFVVVSAENRVKPILAYSTKGFFDASDIAAGFNHTLSSYKDEIEYVRNNDIPVTQDIIDEWTMLEKSGHVTKEKKDYSVEPLLETTWNQNYPYNVLCPEDELGNGGYVYAGCVATAMAQVMRYWNYPVMGANSHSYTPSGYPTQTANFGETHYDFENMPKYLDSLSTEEEIYNVALLQWHCGIAVDMIYGHDGSGAYSEYVPYAISHYFGYNYGYIDYQWSYSNAQWANALMLELDLGRPIYYSGQDDYGLGGHAFVCDGYDESMYFHFNWGWGGRDDAYCAIGALNTTKYAFNTWNSALFDFFPQGIDYYSRPDKINNFTITEVEGENSVNLSWTNPSLTMVGEPMSSIDTVFLKRDFATIAVFTDVQIGENMTFTDEIGEPGLYEYSIYATNDKGNGKPLFESVLVGDKCNLIFEMNDEGGDGWKGGSISVFHDNERIAVITMDEGAELVESVPLLKGDLTFVWNKCWYKDEYYTCDEISFKIKDLNDNVLFEAAENIEAGVLFEYNNDCFECVPPQNLRGEYVWESGDYAALLNWNCIAADVVKFNVYRSNDNTDYELVAEVTANSTDEEYEYYDDVEIGSYYYKVKAYCENNGESCESAAALTENGDDFVFVEVTSLKENVNEIRIYPNPTNGNVFVEAEQIYNINVYNIVGQDVISEEVNDDTCCIDMSEFKEGVYFVKIDTKNGVVTKRLILTY